MSAIVGSALTLLGERELRRRADKQSLVAFLTQVSREVRAVSDIVTERTVAGPFAFQPPLPTEAWRVFVGSGLSRGLSGKPDLIVALNEFYDAVARANYLAAQAVVALQIAQTTPDTDTARAFDSHSVDLSHRPFEDVAAAAPRLLNLLATVER